jgi:hypothetical protein
VVESSDKVSDFDKAIEAKTNFAETMQRLYESGNKVSDQRPEREGREGDSQPLPTLNDGIDIQSLVIDDIYKRRLLGIKRYGTALQANNGRDGLLDAYEEALDLTIYLKQVLVERDSNE